MMVTPRENRIPIMMSDDELKAVDDWRYQNRVATRSSAIRQLVRIGLNCNPQSDGVAFAGVKAESRLANAAGVEPSPSDPHPQEQTSSPVTADMAVAPLPLADATATHPEVPK